MAGMDVRRLLAKVAYRLGGRLYKTVRVPQRYYTWDSASGEFSRLPGRRWAGWSLGLRIGLGWSERLDPVHWEHWAYKHEDCDSQQCASCGGSICGRREILDGMARDGQETGIYDATEGPVPPMR